MTLGMAPTFSFYVPVFTSVWWIGVMKNIIFGQLTSTFHKQRRNDQKRKLFRRGAKGSLKLVWFHTTWHQEWEKEREVVPVLMTGFIHLHCSMPTNTSTSVNTYILNLGIQNMSIERCQEYSHQVREIRICSRCGRRTEDTMCLKSLLMKTWLKEGKLRDSKKIVIIYMFHFSSYINYWEGLDRCKIYSGTKAQKWVVIPGFVQNGLTHNVKMDHKKKFQRSLQTMQLSLIYRYKYTSKEEIESRGLYIFVKLF